MKKQTKLVSQILKRIQNGKLLTKKQMLRIKQNNDLQMELYNDPEIAKTISKTQEKMQQKQHKFFEKIGKKFTTFFG
jgi:hypothetical protein